MGKILGSRKEVYEVIQNKPDVDGVSIDGEHHQFGRSGGIFLEDGAKARDIKQTVGQDGDEDVLVIPTDDQPAEPGHTYMFQHRGVPWAEYDDLGRRVYPEDDE